MKQFILAALLLCGVGSEAFAQVKALKTDKDKSVIVLNLINMTANCQSGPLVIPEIETKPQNGVLLMQPRALDVPAKGSCLAQKVPAVTIIYIPKKNFVGTETVKIAIQVGDKRSELEYSITVTEAGQKI